jgi:FHS family Na+ dependent glucose MFS transporter 1
MAIVLVMMSIMMAFIPLMSSLWLLTAVVFILGLASGTLDVGGNTLLVWVYGHKVGPFMNGLHFCFGVGAFLSPIIIDQALLISGDIIWAYWTLALLIFPVSFWFLKLSSPTDQSIYQNSSMKKFDRLLLALIALFFFLYVGGEVGFGGWIFTYAVKLGLTGETVAAYLTSAFWGAFTLGRLLAIPIAARFRPRFILIGDIVGCLLSLGIILMWPNSLIAIWVGAFGVGLSMASIFPTTLSLAESRMRITGRVTGWFFVGASSGSMFLPWLIGQLFEPIGPRITMVTIMVDMTVALGVSIVLILHWARPVTVEI